MPMKPEKLEKLVLRQGFKLVANKGKGSHRRYQHPDGRTTEINFHSKEIRKGTQEKIFKQIGLK
ncbi:type II toxin-antitoxin system HicA family toxin [Lapidilactobacillus mulanensis]|uniref:Type II toxin-antitoxin system HicA family toxin n=1 Tax=Lapidilactobacillus mulanensis TaxID=2485999 RepID=A0ABW4DPW5_9LACO|nr:type II toxin-antitoxin system HicA family toxin [Lapidilactobacillus mulanensis]